MVIVREKRTEHAVNKACCKDFIIAGASLTLEETAGETACRGEFLLVLHCEGHEIHALACFLCGNDGGEQHGVAHAEVNDALPIGIRSGGISQHGVLQTVAERLDDVGTHCEIEVER